MGKGGGGTTQSTGTTYTTNLPEYAQPYVETMLGATQKQLFNTRDVTDANGNTTTEITGFQPYTPYSTDPSKYVAGFSPLQQQAQKNIAGMQTPGAYGQAQGLAGMSGMGQFGTAQQAGILGGMGTGLGMTGVSAAAPAFGAGQQFMQGVTSPATMQAYMSPYQQAVTDVAKANAVREAQMAQQASNLGAARQGTYGGARQALAQSERERNLLTNLSGIQAQGSQAAYDRALAQQQFGANLGLQGIQTGLQGIQTGMQGVGQGLQGVGAQQAGYAGAGQAASTLGSLAGQEFGTQKDIIGLQQQAGAQQQAQQQQIINQAIQDYANAQQYPMMQLGFMSNMLRGLPMQSTNTQQYVAAPNQLTQGLGAIGTGANIYSAFQGNTTRVAQGGEIKSYAKGGIASYDVGGNVKYDLSNIKDPEELKEIARNTTSDTIRKDALRFAKMREMGLAGGGIVAFADGKTVRGLTAEDYVIPDSPELKARREADIAAALALKAEKDAAAANNPPPGNNSIVAPAISNLLSDPSNYSYSALSEPTQTLKGITAVANKDDAAPAEAPVERNALGETVEEQKRLKKESTSAPVAKKDTPAPVAKKDTPAAEDRKDTGIKAATTTGISRARSGIPGLSPTAQAIYDRSLPEEQSLTDIFKEIKAAREGTIGSNKALQEDRANVMAEKANAQEEARRQGKLRQAKFWADFGSTPGPVLVAAMTAFKKNAEGLIEGEKEARKVQSDLDKIIRDLNKAERLEQEGDFDAAFKIKMDARKEAKDINKVLLQYQMQKETAAIKSDGAGGNKLLGALRYEESVRSKIAKEKNDKNGEYYQARSYLDALKDDGVKTYKDKETQERANKARATIRAKDLEYAKLTDKAKRTVDFYKGVADIDSGNIPSDSADTTTSNPSTVSTKSDKLPEGIPPGSKQIGTFKNNPVYQLPDGSKKVYKQVS